MRIAFFDDHPDNFHANTYLDLLRGPLLGRGASVVGCHALQPEAGRTWAKRREVPWYDDAAALTRTADAMVILAPSTPQTHPELCARVLPAGKPTFVDKTFAASLSEAEAIFALADRHGAPVQSSSALRYADIADAARAMDGPLTRLALWGGGASFAEYAIHPLELAVSLLGHEVEGLLCRGDGRQRQLLLSFSGGRDAVVGVHCGGDTPYLAVLSTATRTQAVQLSWPTLFPRAVGATLDFLVSGQPQVDRRETLAIRRILDRAGDPRRQDPLPSLELPCTSP